MPRRRGTKRRGAGKRAAPKPTRGALRRYRGKRDFARTPEPSGRERPKRVRAPADEFTFVVQKHAARRLHYDFRLELGGVLLSWAIPKGPSLDPSEKRLAVRTEDHPLEYSDFEGVIPEGEYGGGAVMVWDRGRWAPEGDAEDGLKRGRLTFSLRGHKLVGRFHLVRTKGNGKAENWLFFKGKEAAEVKDGAGADEVTEREPKSVVSGRTVEEVAAAPDRVWHSNRQGDTAGDEGGGSSSVGDLGDLIRAIPKRLSSAVELTNLDKVLYPDQGLTKAALVAYYAAAQGRMLPFIADRPLMLVRCPDGQHKQCFFQKHAGRGVPEVVHRVPVREADDADVREYMAVRDTDGLLALIQLGALEIHTWGGRRDQIERPDLLVMDVDPDEHLPWEAVRDAALELRRRLADLSLDSFVKTTGGKGLHVVAPIARRLDWDQCKEFAHGLASAMVRDQPETYVATASKSRRAGKIFIDYLRNARGATAIAPYSTRARAGAPVSAPLGWDELAAGARPGDFTVFTMPARLAGSHPDPWRGFAALRQSITAAARREMGALP